jgi:hypothetical protein
MTTAKKTVVPSATPEDVVNAALKNGDIVPSQQVKVENNTTEDVTVVENKTVEIRGVQYYLVPLEEKEGVSSAKSKHGFYYASDDDTIHVLVPVVEKETIFSKAKTLLKDKRVYIGAGAVAAVLVISAGIVKLATPKPEGETSDENESDQEVAETTSA